MFTACRKIQADARFHVSLPERIAREPRKLGRRHLHNVDISGLELGDATELLGKHAIVDGLNLSGVAEIVWVSRQLQRLIMLPFLQRKRARSDYVVREVAPPSLHFLARHNIGIWHREKADENGKRAFERETYRVIVHNLDAFTALRTCFNDVCRPQHRLEKPFPARARFGRENPLERILDVARRQEASVVESHIAPQRKGIR
jgi:hypothetical protein